MTAKIIDLLLRRNQRTTDAEPLAHKVQREHEADMWAIVKQASHLADRKHKGTK
jgi:hypothetical protein